MIAIKDIKQAVADYYGFAERDLDGPWQSARLVRARQIAIYLAREITMQSLPQIARAFGNRDTKTIVWSINKIEAALADDEDLRNELAALRERLWADEVEQQDHDGDGPGGPQQAAGDDPHCRRAAVRRRLAGRRRTGGL